MGFTSKSRVALVAMIDVAVHQRRGTVTAKSVAQRQQISLSYLEQLISRLRRSGLLAASRGPGGGYMLTRSARDITAMEILGAVDEGRLSCEQGNRGELADAPERVQHDLWAGLDVAIVTYLESVTLQSLLEQQCPSLLQLPERDQADNAAGYDLRAGIKKRRDAPVYAKAATSGFALAQAWGFGSAPERIAA